LNLFHEEDWVAIVKDVRLSQAESALHAWLDEHGLRMTDLPREDWSQEVGRLIGGGSFCTYYVRRSRLEQLLGQDPRGDAEPD